MLAVLELHRRGFILGGKETGKRVPLLVNWGVLDNGDETEYWSLVDAVSERVTRHDAAMPGPDRTWLARSSSRTYLKWTQERLAAVVELDYALRQLSSRPKGLSVGGLRAGPLASDDGTRLDRVIDALQATTLVTRTADGGYCLVGLPQQLGYLEPLWRVYAAVSAECFRTKASSVAFSKVEPLISRRGIGQGPDQRSAGRVREAVNYAKACGVLDAVAVDGRRSAMLPASEISRLFERAYHELYRLLSGRLGTPLPSREVLAEMEAKDASRLPPVFGYDARDRQRILRILVQSELARTRDDKFELYSHPWGEAGARLKP